MPTDNPIISNQDVFCALHHAVGSHHDVISAEGSYDGLEVSHNSLHDRVEHIALHIEATSTPSRRIEESE